MKMSIYVFIIFTISLIMGCNSTSNEKNGQLPVKKTRDINAVKDEYSGEIMKVPGVVGIYIGESDDGIPFIGVMVEKKTKEIEQKIPSKLEGYIVRIEETGKIELR